MYNKKAVHGIALVQVLLITGVISVLLLSLVKMSQQQLNQAGTIERAIQADLDLVSTMNRTQFRLLTENWTQNDWSFHGDAVPYQNATLALQSINGLINLQFDIDPLKALLIQRGVTQSRAERLLTQLKEWQRPDDTESPTLPLQHIRELTFIGDWTSSDVSIIEPYVHNYPSGLANYYYSPADLLSFVLTETQASLITQLRQRDDFSRRDFTQLTGIEADEFTSQFAGPLIRITLEAEQSQTLEVDVAIRPYDNDPLMIYRTNRIASNRSSEE